MNRYQCAFGLSVLFLAVFTQAVIAYSITDRKTVALQIERVRIAFEQKRFDDLPKLCTPNARFKMQTGHWIGISEMVAQLKEFMQPLQEIKISQRITRIVIRGNQAEVKASQTTLGTVTAPPDNMKHKVRAVESYHFVLAKGAQGWRLRSWEPFSGKSYLDGKEQK